MSNQTPQQKTKPQSTSPLTPKRIIPPDFRTIYRRRMLILKIAQTLAAIADLESFAKQDEHLVKLNLCNSKFDILKSLRELSIVDLCMIDCVLQRLCSKIDMNKRPGTQAYGEDYALECLVFEYIELNRIWEEFEWAFFCNDSDMYEQMETIAQTVRCPRSTYLPFIVACGLFWEGASFDSLEKLKWTDIDFVEGTIPNARRFDIKVSEYLMECLREAQGMRFTQPLEGTGRSPYIFGLIDYSKWTKHYYYGIDTYVCAVYAFWRKQCAKLPQGHIYKHKRFSPMNISVNGQCYRNLYKDVGREWCLYDAASAEFLDDCIRDQWRDYYNRQVELFWLTEGTFSDTCINQQ